MGGTGRLGNVNADKLVCLPLLCSLPSLDAVWTSDNKCHLLRICFSLGMHGQQNLSKNVLACMTIVISKGSQANPDLLCGLETYKNPYRTVCSSKDGLCGSPVFSLGILLCMPFCSQC